MKSKILITSGSVIGNLSIDSFSSHYISAGTIGNQFLERMAGDLAGHSHVILLKPKLAKDTADILLSAKGSFEIQYFTDFVDYKKQVLAFAKICDGMLLGADIPNFLPKNNLIKFEKTGSTFVEFVPVERIIDQVKTVNPSIFLIGTKRIKSTKSPLLMSNINIARKLLKKSKADMFWISNYGNYYDKKFDSVFVTKDGYFKPTYKSKYGNYCDSETIDLLKHTFWSLEVKPTIKHVKMQRGLSMAQETTQKFQELWGKYPKANSIALKIREKIFISTASNPQVGMLAEVKAPDDKCDKSWVEITCYAKVKPHTDILLMNKIFVDVRGTSAIVNLPDNVKSRTKKEIETKALREEFYCVPSGIRDWTHSYYWASNKIEMQGRGTYLLMKEEYEDDIE